MKMVSPSLPKTLSDWVKDFRMKKMQLKRKFRAGGNLRVCAIMATALLSAENQLRCKQQERLHRCIQMQSKFHETLNGSAPMSSPTPISAIEYEEEDEKRRMEICNLWKDELNELDEFMRKMSSNHNSNLNSSNNVQTSTAFGVTVSS